MTIIDYDPGSRGAMSYLDASRELANRDQTAPGRQWNDTAVTAQGRPWPRSASLIPTGPSDGPGGPRMGEAAADIVLGGGTQIDAVAVGADYREIPPSQIEPNPQPRQVFDEEALAELVHSIREFGLMQPIIVRPIPGARRRAPRYQLVMGSGAGVAQQVGLFNHPAIVRKTEDGDLLRDALLENIHRAQLESPRKKRPRTSN